MELHTHGVCLTFLRNRWWNVDVFGLLRGKYLTPAFAVKIGENAIRNCLKEQLTAIKQEGVDYMGEHPCLFSEIGIPFDMDDKHAYKTGDYLSQVLAMDANHFALEGSGAAGFTLWTYVATVSSRNILKAKLMIAQNNHEWGDQWNGEDLSIFSIDDKPLPMVQSSKPQVPVTNESTTSINTSPSFSQSRSITGSQTRIMPSNLKETIVTPTISRSPSLVTGGDLATSGYRAAEAYVRPSPIYTAGKVISYVFDLQNCTFSFTLKAEKPPAEDAPTEVTLPAFHFPRQDAKVEVSSGKWSISIDEADQEMGLVQRFRWWHGAGEQKLTIKGIKRKLGSASGEEREEEVGYLDQCQEQTNKCRVM